MTLFLGDKTLIYKRNIDNIRIVKKSLFGKKTYTFLVSEYCYTNESGNRIPFLVYVESNYSNRTSISCNKKNNVYYGLNGDNLILIVGKDAKKMNIKDIESKNTEAILEYLDTNIYIKNIEIRSKKFLKVI